jgi:hypothetical protein
MGGRGGLEGWRWIIIIEGILTALVGVIAYFVLPETIDKAAFLTPEERHLAVQRIMADRPVEIDASGRMVVVNEQFKWKDVIAPLISPMVSNFMECRAFVADPEFRHGYQQGLILPSLPLCTHSPCLFQLCEFPRHSQTAVDEG